MELCSFIVTFVYSNIVFQGYFALPGLLLLWITRIHFKIR